MQEGINVFKNLSVLMVLMTSACMKVTYSTEVMSDGKPCWEQTGQLVCRVLFYLVE